MKRFVVLVILVALLGTIFGCGNHRRTRPAIVNNVAIVDSSTTAGVPSNTAVIIQQPPAFDQNALIAAILSELEAFSLSESIEVNVTIEVNNNTDVDCQVVIDGDRIIITPGHLKHIPSLYHWLCKAHGKNCQSGLCDQFPKPCDNEED